MGKEGAPITFVHTREVSSTTLSSPTVEAQTTSPEPRSNSRWLCILCVAMINAHSWGINSSYSVFLAQYLANDTFTGTSHLQYAFVASTSIGLTLFVAPLSTIVVRECGAKPVMFCGALTLSLSLACASLSTQLWQIFLSQGALFGVGLGFMFLPSVTIIAEQFPDRSRGLANGIVSSGACLGGLTYSLCSRALINNFGLEWTFRVLSIITLVVNVGCILCIKNPPKAVKADSLAFDASFLRRIEYLLVLAFSSLSMMGYFVLIYTLANYGDEIGLTKSQSAVAAALFSLGQAVGRPIMGHFIDSVGCINITTLCTFLAGILPLGLWITAKSYAVLITFAILEGTIGGIFWVTVAPLMTEVVGLKSLPSGLSVLWMVMALPSTSSAPIAIQIVDQTGSYLGAQLFTGSMFLAATICMILLRGWKIRQVANQQGTMEPGKPGNQGRGVKESVASCCEWRIV